MNYAIVLRLLSYILYCEAALLLLPAMARDVYKRQPNKLGFLQKAEARKKVMALSEK